jgi:hypothetical protein
LKSAAIANPAVSTSKLNPNPIGHPGYAISSDGSRVVFLNTPGPAPSFELYSVPVTGTYTDSVRISGLLPMNGTDKLTFGFQLSPDGRRVVFRADQDVSVTNQLYVTDEDYLLKNQVFLPLIRR